MVRSVVRDLVLPPTMAVRRPQGWMVALALVYVGYILLLVTVHEDQRLVLAPGAPGLVLLFAAVLGRALRRHRRTVVATNLGLVQGQVVHGLVSTVVLATLATPPAVAFVWPHSWQASLAVVASFVVVLHLAFRRAYRRAFAMPLPTPPPQLAAVGGGRRGR
jgi:hypothetical protein